LLVTWSGTAFRATAGPGELFLHLQGPDDASDLFFNVANEHLAVPASEAVFAGLVPGPHTLSIDASGASTDANDVFKITCVEVMPNP
jgi:hypothetical protein